MTGYKFPMGISPIIASNICNTYLNAEDTLHLFSFFFVHGNLCDFTFLGLFPLSELRLGNEMCFLC